MKRKLKMIILVGLVLALTFIIIIHKRRRSNREGDPPPGPAGLPLIGNLHEFMTTATPHIYLWELSKKHGPLMSLQLGSVPVVVVSSARVAREALKTHDVVFSGRPRALGQHGLSYQGLDIAFAPYGDLWRELRKVCVLHLLSNKHVQSFRSVREDEVRRMLHAVAGDADSGRPTNLSSATLMLTSNLICRIAFGHAQCKKALSTFQRFDELMIESQAMQGGVFFSDYLPLFGWVDRLSGMKGRLDRICKDFDDFYEDLIIDHLDPIRVKPANPDILDILIKLKEEKSSSVDLTWDHIKAILFDVFVAGTDTAAATIVWTMTFLIKHQRVMTKLQNEIRDSVGEKGLVDEDDLSNLPYLKAVIKESMRLQPPLPLLLPRETTESCVIDGCYTIQPKTLVYINAYAIGRDPDAWECPDEFIPERFFNSSIDVMGQDFQLLSFGGGRRGCPGIFMGLAVVETTVANLVYGFDWEVPAGMNEEDIDTEVLPGLATPKKNPLRLVPKKNMYYTT